MVVIDVTNFPILGLVIGIKLQPYKLAFRIAEWFWVTLPILRLWLVFLYASLRLQYYERKYHARPSR